LFRGYHTDFVSKRGIFEIQGACPRRSARPNLAWGNGQCSHWPCSVENGPLAYTRTGRLFPSRSPACALTGLGAAAWRAQFGHRAAFVERPIHKDTVRASTGKPPQKKKKEVAPTVDLLAIGTVHRPLPFRFGNQREASALSPGRSGFVIRGKFSQAFSGNPKLGGRRKALALRRLRSLQLPFRPCCASDAEMIFERPAGFRPPARSSRGLAAGRRLAQRRASSCAMSSRGLVRVCSDGRPKNGESV